MIKEVSLVFCWILQYRHTCTLLLSQRHTPSHVFPQNVTANHRVNDAVFTEDGAQMVTGRFMYGPLDMVTLTGEKVRNQKPRVMCLRVSR